MWRRWIGMESTNHSGAQWFLWKSWNVRETFGMYWAGEAGSLLSNVSLTCQLSHKKPFLRPSGVHFQFLKATPNCTLSYTWVHVKATVKRLPWYETTKILSLLVLNAQIFPRFFSRIHTWPLRTDQEPIVMPINFQHKKTRKQVRLRFWSRLRSRFRWANALKLHWNSSSGVFYLFVLFLAQLFFFFVHLTFFPFVKRNPKGGKTWISSSGKSP